jgi:FKBP-type peptidyl-prolyl cis-trans isomerase
VKDPTGIYYKKTLEIPVGREMNETYVIGIVYTLKTFDGKEILKATAADSAIVNFYSSQAFEGFFYSMLLLKEGEKGIFYIPSTLAYQDQPISGLNPWQPIILEMEVPRIYNEKEQIDEYYLKSKITPDSTTATGLRVNFLTIVPDGKPVKGNKFIKVNYKGSFLSGSVFDTGSLDVEIGVAGVIKGFEEGLLLLRKGEKAVITFPSAIGYGTTGQGNSIPPHTPLKFDVEIVEVQ